MEPRLPLAECSVVAWVPDRGDVIWIDHNPQAGRERKDHHPFVVLSTAAFHRTMGLVVGCAMTSAAYNRGAVAHPGLNPHHRLWPLAPRYRLGHTDRISPIDRVAMINP